MKTPKQTTWNWPDHIIRKRESRQLREEHNALANEHAELLDALRECITNSNAYCFASDPTIPKLRARLYAITDHVRATITKAAGGPITPVAD